MTQPNNPASAKGLAAVAGSQKAPEVKEPVAATNPNTGVAAKAPEPAVVADDIPPPVYDFNFTAPSGVFNCNHVDGRAGLLKFDTNGNFGTNDKAVAKHLEHYCTIGAIRKV